MIVQLSKELYVQLNGDASLYFPKQHLLVIADLHAGKAMHFRKNGLPIPLTKHDQESFLNAIRKHQDLKPEAVLKLILLGDNLHSFSNLESNQLFEKLYAFSNLENILIVGNHDVMSLDVQELWGEVVAFYQFENLIFLHGDTLAVEEVGMNSIIETGEEEVFLFCGHLHPAVGFKLDGQNLRFPAFVFHEKARQFFVPAFGDFKGNMLFKRERYPNFRFYPIVNGRVVAI